MANPSSGPFIPAKPYGATSAGGHGPNSLSAPPAPAHFIPAAQRAHAAAQHLQFHPAPQVQPAPGFVPSPSDRTFYAASWTGSQPTYPLPPSHHVTPPTQRTYQFIPPRMGPSYPPGNFRPAQ